MKFLFLYVMLSTLTFFIGVGFAPKSYPLISLEEIATNSDPLVSLEEITANSELYDGKNVEIITYAQLSRIDEESIQIGEPFEKYEASTLLDLKENSLNLDSFKKDLSVNYSLNNYNRVKVKVSGTVEDNCNRGIPCCFGKTLTITTKNVRQIGQIEKYTVPAEFQLNHEK